MNTLTVCSFDDSLEIGIFQDGGPFWLQASRSAVQHSEKLVVGIQALAREAGLALSDLDLLACVRGPGSFTGLRIGMAALKGLALALDRPLVSVPTMEVLSWGLEFFDGAVAPVLDARKRRFYCAVFERGRRVSPDLDIRPEDLAPLLAPYPRVLLAGKDAGAFASRMGSAAARISIDSRQGTRSEALRRLALRQLEEAGPDDIGQGPVYIRRSDAEENLLAKGQE